MSNFNSLEIAIPVAPLCIIALESATELSKKVDTHLVECRKISYSMVSGDPAFEGYSSHSYLFNASCPRFGSGEAKCKLNDSVRGKDVYIMVDICNHSITYTMHGHENSKSPDDHYQDLKRVIAALSGHAKRITVIMPFLYEGRQHKRSSRESLDCANALLELKNMGVSNVITFDAHDPRVLNATPLSGFDNFNPFHQYIHTLLEHEKNLIIDKEHTVVISPDEGALPRAIYFANVLGIDTGMFYKRRDYTTIVNGKNPIVAHEFLGDAVKGKDVIIVDDMISSGESMLDTAKQLKIMKAKRVFICCTFGLFTDGLENFDNAYKNNIFDRVITTNLTYLLPEVQNRDYITIADNSKYLASLIDYLNHDISLDNALDPENTIHELIQLYNEKSVDFMPS
jgi:ribose-phosphate pyrophosphokinase